MIWPLKLALMALVVVVTVVTIVAMVFVVAVVATILDYCNRYTLLLWPSRLLQLS